MSDQNVNDWDGLSEELEAMKVIARHEGYMAAMEEMQALREEVRKEHEALKRTIQMWHAGLALIRTAWGKTTGQPATTEIPDSWRRRPIFGHSEIKSDDKYPATMNMPEDLDEFGQALLNQLGMAEDFRILLEAFEKHPMVKQQWDRLLVMMKMTDE